MTTTEPTEAILVPEPLPATAPLPEGQPSLTPQQARVAQVAGALEDAYAKGSELLLSDEERKALAAPFPDDQIEKRPHDGLLYIPHILVSGRLCDVLGAGQWCMIRRREWIEGTRIYAEYVMKVRGCYVGESIGAMEYHPNNPRMNYSDALEGTRGECIRRIAAKDLNCGAQVWSPAYCRGWEERRNAAKPQTKAKPATTAAPETKPSRVSESDGLTRCDAKFVEFKEINSKPGAKPWRLFACRFESDSGSQFECCTFDAKIGETLPVLVGHEVTIQHKPGRKVGTLELMSIEPSDDLPM